MERAIRLEHLGMPHGDGVAAPPADPESDPTGDVLATVERPSPVTTRRPVDRQRGDDADRRCSPGLDASDVEWHDRDARPAPVVEARAVPVGTALPEVGRAPVVEVGGSDLPGRRPPILIGGDHDPTAIGAVDLELSDEPDLLAVVASLVPRLPAEAASIPSVAEDRPDRIRPRGQERRDVVRVGEEAVAV